MPNEDKYPAIFQSGQPVDTPGLYEVVGAGYVYSHDENASCEFRSGQIFPDYQGRAVCWHLIRVIEVASVSPNVAPSEIHTP